MEEWGATRSVARKKGVRRRGQPIPENVQSRALRSQKLQTPFAGPGTRGAERKRRVPKSRTPEREISRRRLHHPGRATSARRLSSTHHTLLLPSCRPEIESLGDLL